jgi:hypothetical protein
MSSRIEYLLARLRTGKCDSLCNRPQMRLEGERMDPIALMNKLNMGVSASHRPVFGQHWEPEPDPGVSEHAGDLLGGG